MHAFSSVANRPLSLAKHLRNVATLLKNGALFYLWTEAASCNCGLLAASLLGISAHDLELMLDSQHEANLGVSDGNTWTSRASRHCPLTGEPTDAIFKRLASAGLKFSDYHELEYLANDEIRARAEEGFSVTFQKKRLLMKPVTVTEPAKLQFDDRISVAAYFFTWATMIEEFHAKSAEAALDAIEDRPLVANI